MGLGYGTGEAEGVVKWVLKMFLLGAYRLYERDLICPYITASPELGTCLPYINTS